MPYILYKTNGQKLVTVEDGSINKTASDITFVGKNYAGYGEILNQNLVKILENFANVAAPPRPLIGQLFYNTSEKKLQVYDGTRFKPLSSLEITTSVKPISSIKGDLWFNENEQRLYVYNGTKHVLIGPITSEFNGVSLVPAIAKTDNDLNKFVLKFTIEDEFAKAVTAVVSRDEFIPNVADDLTVENFNIVKQGITLPGSNPITGDSTGKGYYFWGTAAHALRLGNYAANEYALQTFVTGLINTNGLFIANRLGINIFDGFRIAYDPSNKEGQFVGLFDTDKISFNVNYLGNTTTVLTINGNTLLPNISVGTNLGTDPIRFHRLFFNTGSITNLFNTNATIVNSTITNASITNLNVTGSFTGNLTGSSTGVFTGPTTGTHRGNVISNDGSMTILDAGAKSLVADSTTIANGFITVFNSTNATISNLNNTNASIVDLTVTTSTHGKIVTDEIFATGGLTASPGTMRGSWTIQGNWTLAAGSTMQATYADVAERYHADGEYEPGTVLIIGGEHEVTISTERASTSVAGIVSTAPAYTMNELAGDDSTHPYIALKGRVPCKVVGKIRKGERLVSSNVPGYATAMSLLDDPSAVFAIALQDNDTEIGVIEVKV